MKFDRRALLKGGGLAGAAVAASPALAVPGAAAIAGHSPRRRELLDSGWRFHLGHAADMARDFGFGRNQRTFAKAGAATADAAMAKYDDSGWTEVRVPHDWAVDLPFAPPNPPAPKETEDAVAAHGFKAIGRDHPGNSVGWYRRALDIRPADRGRAIWLEFDGVFRDSIVFVNGYVAGGSDSGYAPFKVEIGDFLDYDGGPNVVTVRCDASLGEGWFYEGAGIYRNVALVSAAPVHVPMWGVFVRAEPGTAGALVSITTEVRNDRAVPANVSLRHVIADADRSGQMVEPVAVALAARAERSVEQAVTLPRPRLWSVDTPHLYRLITSILVDGEEVDRVETLFGVRSIAFDAQRGFFLNGQRVSLLGSCNHQDHAGVGSAIPDALHAWRVEQLQAMGSNAWRSAHNPASQALLDVCDARGMLMITEARLNSTSAEAIDQLDRLVRSSRNHPSIILWSVGNEEPHQGTATGANISAEMVARVKALDPTRPTTQAFDQHFGKGATRVVDVVGFNYRIDKIEAFHAAHPDIPVIGSETGSTVSTRGEYATDAARHIVRAYDTEHPWWASTAEEWWTIVAERPYIAGGFIWTGFDYRGEPTPYALWPSVSSYFGVLDLCGFPKDGFHYYRSWWRAEPMVHLLPHWSWPGKEGQPIEVWAYSNCDEVELFVNGRSAGRKAMRRGGHLVWSVPYAAGSIEARGFRAGRQIARDRRVTAGAPARVVLTSDRRRIKGDGRDVAMIRAEIVDRAGVMVPTASNLVDFTLSGPARLIGVGNGDPTSSEPDHAPRRKAFNGLAQAIVQSDPKLGPIRVTATAAGLRGTTLTLDGVA